MQNSKGENGVIFIICYDREERVGVGATLSAALLTLTIRVQSQVYMIKNISRCVLVTHLISWVLISHIANHDGNVSLQLCRLCCVVYGRLIIIQDFCSSF